MESITCSASPTSFAAVPSLWPPPQHSASASCPPSPARSIATVIAIITILTVPTATTTSTIPATTTTQPLATTTTQPPATTTTMTPTTTTKAAVGTCQISDITWTDTNGNGVLDPGEKVLGGVTVQVTGPDGSIRTTVA